MSDYECRSLGRRPPSAPISPETKGAQPCHWLNNFGERGKCEASMPVDAAWNVNLLSVL